MQICAAYQDLPILQFWSKSHYPFWSYFPFFFYQIFKILILFVLYFKNYKRQVVSWNCKHVQHVKIYLPCNFEVNPITHFDQLCKLEKRGDEIKKKIFLETSGPIATKLLWNDPWMAPFQIVSGDPDFQPRWPPS